MSSKGMTISAAKVKMKSSIVANKIYPKDGSETVSIRLSKSEAIKLCSNILALCTSEKVEEPIVLTGYKNTNRITLLGTLREEYIELENAESALTEED